MLLTDAVRKRVKNLLNEKNMNIWKLYIATGIPFSTLNYFINHERGLITLRTLLHICEGLNIELKEFFDDPLFDNVIDEET